MHSISSFLLSLLLFVTVMGTQLVAAWPTASGEALAPVQVAQCVPAGDEVLQAFDDGPELDRIEWSLYRSPHAAELHSVVEDHHEFFGAPESTFVSVAHAQAAPHTRATHQTAPWPDSMLRPPNQNLPTAG